MGNSITAYGGRTEGMLDMIGAAKESGQAAYLQSQTESRNIQNAVDTEKLKEMQAQSAFNNTSMNLLERPEVKALPPESQKMIVEAASSLKLGKQVSDTEYSISNQEGTRLLEYLSKTPEMIEKITAPQKLMYAQRTNKAFSDVQKAEKGLNDAVTMDDKTKWEEALNKAKDIYSKEAETYQKYYSGIQLATTRSQMTNALEALAAKGVDIKSMPKPMQMSLSMAMQSGDMEGFNKQLLEWQKEESAAKNKSVKGSFQEKGVTARGGYPVVFNPDNAKTYVNSPEGLVEYNPKTHGRINGLATSQTTIYNMQKDAKAEKTKVQMLDEFSDLLIDGKLTPSMVGSAMGAGIRKADIIYAASEKAKKLGITIDFRQVEANLKGATSATAINTGQMAKAIEPLFGDMRKLVSLLPADVKFAGVDLTSANSAKRHLAKLVGDEDVTNFEQMRKIIVEESERLLTGAGAMADQRVVRSINMIKTSYTRKQMLGSINMLQKAVEAREAAVKAPVYKDAISKKGGSSEGIDSNGRTPLKFN